MILGLQTGLLVTQNVPHTTQGSLEHKTPPTPQYDVIPGIANSLFFLLGGWGLFDESCYYSFSTRGPRVGQRTTCHRYCFHGYCSRGIGNERVIGPTLGRCKASVADASPTPIRCWDGVSKLFWEPGRLDLADEDDVANIIMVMSTATISIQCKQ